MEINARYAGPAFSVRPFCSTVAADSNAPVAIALDIVNSGHTDHPTFFIELIPKEEMQMLEKQSISGT